MWDKMLFILLTGSFCGPFQEPLAPLSVEESQTVLFQGTDFFCQSSFSRKEPSFKTIKIYASLDKKPILLLRERLGLENDLPCKVISVEMGHVKNLNLDELIEFCRSLKEQMGEDWCYLHFPSNPKRIQTVFSQLEKYCKWDLIFTASAWMEKLDLSLFHPLESDFVAALFFSACKEGLDPKDPLDQLLSLHILEEFVRLRAPLEQKGLWSHFGYTTLQYPRPPIPRKEFYVEDEKKTPLKIGDSFFHPSLFLLNTFTQGFNLHRCEIEKLGKEQVQKIYDEQSENVDGGIYFGDRGEGFRLFLQKDGKEIVWMTDQALNCLQAFHPDAPRFLDKVKMHEALFEHKKPCKAALLLWYVVSHFSCEYDCFFVPL